MQGRRCRASSTRYFRLPNPADKTKSRGRSVAAAPWILKRKSKKTIYQLLGEVAEWLKAPHSKCGIRATVSGVRIPPSPPNYFNSLCGNFASGPRRDP